MFELFRVGVIRCAKYLRRPHYYSLTCYLTVFNLKMPTEEERDYNELLRCYQNLQRQHRNVVKKHQASTQRIKKLSIKISTLKLRQEAKEKEKNDRSCSNLVKEKKDAATATTTSTKDNDDLQKTNQRLKMHLQELASQHDLDTLRLALQDEKLKKILKFHNEYKARHVALKEELHFLEIERNQLEEYKEEVSDLREQNMFLEEKVQELILQGVVNNQEGED